MRGLTWSKPRRDRLEASRDTLEPTTYLIDAPADDVEGPCYRLGGTAYRFDILAADRKRRRTQAKSEWHIGNLLRTDMKRRLTHPRVSGPSLRPGLHV
jgi:hypothetical protein